MYESAGTALAPSLEEAVQRLAADVTALDGCALSAADDRAVLDAAVALAQIASRLAGRQLRLLAEVDRRDAYRHDGAVTTASWYRGRTRLEHGQAARQVQAAVRLARLPRLAAALDAGDVTFAHVSAVTDAAVPRRMAAIAAAEDTLVELARAASPRELRIALRRIGDVVDPDGTASPPLDASGRDERRHLDVRPTIDGLVELRGTMDQIDGEALLTALDAMDTPDPPATPPHLLRSPGQRRADALGALARAVLDTGAAPTVAGNKPHLLLSCDLPTLLGDDGLATRRPRLRFTGELPADRARRLAGDCKLTAVLTLGPWRVVNVGRTHRTLPAWLRAPLEMLHRHCRGPDCDRPAVWADAHHEHDWIGGGDTDLNATIPLCRAHHTLVTSGGWQVAMDRDTGTCTWHGPTGHTITTAPPPP